MKVLILVFFFTLAPLVHAAGTSNTTNTTNTPKNCAEVSLTVNDCTEVLFNLDDWSDLSAQATTCLESNENFQKGISTLCDASRSQLSTEYTQFLKYQKEYEDTLGWYQGLSPQEQLKASAKLKLQLAKENWETLGQKNRLRAVKSRLDESFRSCNPI